LRKKLSPKGPNFTEASLEIVTMMKGLLLAAGAVVARGVNETALANCYDIIPADNVSADPAIAKCYKHVLWAKQVGITTEPDFYSNFNQEDITPASDLGIFQCALWHKSVNKQFQNGQEGHNCPHPCTPQNLRLNVGPAEPICQGDVRDTNLNSQKCLYNVWGSWSICIADHLSHAGQRTRTRTVNTSQIVGAKIDCSGEASETATCTVAKSGNSKESGGWPWWAWLLLVLGVCVALPCLALCCAAALCYEAVSFILDPIFGGKKPQKKKRAVKKPVAAPAVPAAPAVTPVTTSITHPIRMVAPVATTAVPMPAYTYATPPVTTAFAAPVAAPAASVTYAAPIAAPAASVSYAVPMAAPVASASYAAPMQLLR